MNIHLTQNYKSLTPFEWNDVPDFAVVVGPNGSGKTHLLQLIEVAAKTHGNTKKTHGNTLSGISVQPDEILLISHDFSELKPVMVDTNRLSSNQNTLWNTFRSIQQQTPAKRLRYDPTSVAGRLFAISETLGLSVDNVDEALFRSQVLANYEPNRADIFSERASRTFLTYYMQKLHDAALSQAPKIPVDSIPPWRTLDTLLSQFSLPLEVVSPEDLGPTFSYDLTLKNTQTGFDTKVSDLSSGERALVSISIWLMLLKEDQQSPKLLLLDEPDAHLHPPLVKRFLNSITEEIVKRHSIRVIMTSHQPTTITLAPPESIFEITSTPETSITNQPAAQVRSALTEGTISVLKSCRYILVEDSADHDFYSSTYTQLLHDKQLSTSIPLVFLSAGKNRRDDSTGGSNEVRKWCEKLCSPDLDDLFLGIVDRDNLSSPLPSTVQQLPRYEIENYLIDPIVVYSVLLDSDQAPDIDSVTVIRGRIRETNQDTRQRIANYIFNDLSGEGSIPTDAKWSCIEFTSGMTLQYPTWIRDTKGKEILGILQKKYGGDLMNQKKLLKAYDALGHIPKELHSVLQNLIVAHK